MIKALTTVSIEGTYLNLMKAIYDKPIANIILSGEKLKGFLLKLTYGQLIFNKKTKETRIYNRKKTVSSASGVGKFGQPHANQ